MEQKINNMETVKQWTKRQILNKGGWAITYCYGNRCLSLLEIEHWMPVIYSHFLNTSHSVPKAIFSKRQCFSIWAAYKYLGGALKNPVTKAHPRPKPLGVGPRQEYFGQLCRWSDSNVLEDHVSKCLVWLLFLGEGTRLKGKGGGKKSRKE